MRLLSCGSNGSGQLALGDAEDRSTLNPTLFDSAIEPATLEGAEIVDIASAAHHSLLLVRFPLNSHTGESSACGDEEPAGARDGGGAGWRYELYGAGTNTYGQLGRRCALRDEDAPPQSWSRWRRLNLLPSHTGDGWEPRCIGATWTTSFVVYRRYIAATGSSSSGGGSSSSAAGKGAVEVVVIAAGSNDFGELGIAPILHAHDEDEALDDDGHAQGAGPREVDVGLEPGEMISDICCGQRHVLCLVQDQEGRQRLAGWGASRKGELDPSSAGSNGASSFSTQSLTAIPDRRATSLDNASGIDKGKGKTIEVVRPSARPRTTLPRTLKLDLRSDERITRLAAGASHSVALLSSGRVLAWGSDAKGQITGLNEVQGVKGAACMWNGTFVQTEGGVLSQGSNTHSQLVRSSLSERDQGSGDDAGSRDVDVTRGANRKVDGRGLVRWAEHASGDPSIPMSRKTAQQDASTRAPAAAPSPPPPPLLAAEIKHLVCGTEHVLIHTSTGHLWAGGWNEHGNLGQGDQVDRGRLERVEVDGAVKGVWAGCAASWVWVD